MDIMERLLDVAADRSGDGPSGPAYDPELLTVMSEAADEISRLRGTHAADDERLATAAQRVGIVAGCDAAEWMADEIARLRDENAKLRADQDECDALRGKMADILTRTATALRGEPEPLHLHGWHDLPERVTAVMNALAGAMELASAHVMHDSDCATHNEPAYPNGPCDCSAAMQKGE